MYGLGIVTRYINADLIWERSRFVSGLDFLLLLGAIDKYLLKRSRLALTSGCLSGIDLHVPLLALTTLTKYKGSNIFCFSCMFWL